MKQRGISIKEIKSVDEVEYIDNAIDDLGSNQYIKYLKKSAIKIIYRIDEKNNVIIITCFRINKRN